MTPLVHLDVGGRPRWAVRRDDVLYALPVGLADLLAMPLAEARAAVEAAGAPLDAAAGRLLAPVDIQEVWAAGVTYRRSREGRREESDTAGALYEAVYDAARPELFFKSTGARVVGDGQPIGIRADSGWDVPEAELALVVNSAGDIFGYTVGNDVSSRSIEGENPLYLPQAKIYTGACALGPAIIPAWEAGAGPFDIAVRIERAGRPVYAGTISTAELARTPTDLIAWLRRALDFPAGVVLLTGTGIVPERDVALRPGDVVIVDIDGIGRLRNPVAVVGR